MLCTELFLVGGSNMKIQGMLVVSLIGTVIVDFGLTKVVLDWKPMLAYVLSHSHFPLNTPFLSNQILLVTKYSFNCIWILYFWFLTLLNMDCFSLIISLDCRAKCSVAASIKWAFIFFLFTNVPQPTTLNILEIYSCA